jgi:hypothetical protein
MFVREGSMSAVVFADVTAHLQDSLGMQYIARLLRHPNREFDVADLDQGIGSLHPPVAEKSSAALIQQLLAEGLRSAGRDAYPLLDARGQAACRVRID